MIAPKYFKRVTCLMVGYEASDSATMYSVVAWLYIHSPLLALLMDSLEHEFQIISVLIENHPIIGESQVAQAYIIDRHSHITAFFASLHQDFLPINVKKYGRWSATLPQVF